VNSDFPTEEEANLHRKMAQISNSVNKIKENLPPHLAALPKYLNALKQRKGNLLG
jgi:hypothetical protein